MEEKDGEDDTGHWRSEDDGKYYFAEIFEKDPGHTSDSTDGHVEPSKILTEYNL